MLQGSQIEEWLSSLCWSHQSLKAASCSLLCCIYLSKPTSLVKKGTQQSFCMFENRNWQKSTQRKPSPCSALGPPSSVLASPVVSLAPSPRRALSQSEWKKHSEINCSQGQCTEKLRNCQNLPKPCFRQNMTPKIIIQQTSLSVEGHMHEGSSGQCNFLDQKSCFKLLFSSKRKISSCPL